MKGLARPSLGHWRAMIRDVLPIAAEDSQAFRKLNEILQSKQRLPWDALCGLDAAMEGVLSESQQRQSRSTVSLGSLFDRIVQYRNLERGHSGHRESSFRERMGASLIAGAIEFLDRVDILGGHQLIYLSDIRQLPAVGWQLQGFALVGRSSVRLEPWTATQEAVSQLPMAQTLYLVPSCPTGPYVGQESIQLTSLKPLHPLVVFDDETENVFFLNARRGEKGVELLCYSSGEHRREESPTERCALLQKLLRRDFATADLEDCEEQLLADAETTQASVAVVDEVERRYLGDFELISRIGRGGMGIVYKARQLSLDRLVAVKKLTNAGASTSIDRFKREILALGKVDHPSLVKIYASGADLDDRFYAMELVEGADLSEVLSVLRNSSEVTGGIEFGWQAAVSTACELSRTKETPVDQPAYSAVAADAAKLAKDESPSTEEMLASDLGPEYIRQCLDLTHQIAEALDALHHAGVVHRDVKPGNIMVTTAGDRAVLTDLGLAQIDESDANLTRTRQFVGTLQYASPEQILAAYKVDSRSDIYSLGATLWEALTLRRLFDAGKDVSEQELIRRIQRKRPPRASRYNKHVSADLDAVVAKCLEKDEGTRYQSAADVATDLQCVRRGQKLSRQKPPSKKFFWGATGSLVALTLVAINIYGSLATKYRSGVSDNTVPRIVNDTAVAVSRRSGGIHSADSTKSILNAASVPQDWPTSYHVLLVGCGKYPNHPAGDLLGPANDVAVLKQVLVSRLGIEESRIQTLIDAEATRHSIERAFLTLAENADNEQTILIYLSGHGAQVTNANGDELDGYDEVFLPSDVVPPRDQIPLTNAIIDDEMQIWLKRIQKTGASVLLFSGQPNSRSFADEAASEIYAERGDQAAPSSPINLDHEDHKSKKQLGAFAAFYACRPEQMTEETRGERFGLVESESRNLMYSRFAIAVASAFVECESPVTLAEFMQAIRKQNRLAPEGRTDSPFFEVTETADRISFPRSAIELRLNESAGQRLTLNQGLLDGTQVGDVFGVVAHNDIIGHVRVEGLDLLSSTVNPCEYLDSPEVSQFTTPVSCVPVYRLYGKLELAIGTQLASEIAQRKTEANRITERVSSVVSEFAESKESSLRLTVAGESPNLRLLATGTPLQPMATLELGVFSELGRFVRTGALGPVEIDDAFDNWLRRSLKRIERAENLRFLATRAYGNTDGAIVVKSKVRWRDSRSDETEFRSRGEVNDGDRLQLDLSNVGQIPVDVTVLFIGNDWSIETFFPLDGMANRIFPGESLQTPIFLINDSTTGWEDLIILAARADKPFSLDFSFLGQDTYQHAVETERTSRGRSDPDRFDTPLGRLLATYRYGVGETRGVEVGAENFSIERISWNVVSSE